MLNEIRQYSIGYTVSVATVSEEDTQGVRSSTGVIRRSAHAELLRNVSFDQIIHYHLDEITLARCHFFNNAENHFDLAKVLKVLLIFGNCFL